ncbi:uncharacterized protein N7482_002825 [Penicillium canariense]|uniref:Uncharacterized protein n=1 Tax=Penicillium canariense TaxID=189055 RepID=A0A9W9IFY4_9EURO|nr:uncharacterized protein N7482_002825 [Penicillium canariense]KAJ5176948.1 hypothetical protein N7482_002825 [Penicillium canariense]
MPTKPEARSPKPRSSLGVLVLFVYITEDYRVISKIFKMCVYEVVQYTGRVSCGHVYITKVVRCREAFKRADKSPCADPKTRALNPKAPNPGGVWVLMKKCSSEEMLLDGPCPQCKSRKVVDMTRFLPFPFEDGPLKRLMKGEQGRPQKWYTR